MKTGDDAPRRGVPEWARLIVFGLSVLAIERLFADWVATLVAGRVDERVRENGPWVGIAMVVLALVGLAASDEKLRRVLATERGARTVDRTRLSGLRAFSLGFGLFVFLFFGGLQVLRWMALGGLPQPAIIATAVALLVVGIWRIVAGVGRLERRAHGDASPPGRRWLVKLPNLAIDTMVALWSAGGLGAVWTTFSSEGNLAFHDPDLGKVLAGALGAGLFFVLFNLPWRHPQHLLTSVRSGGHRPLVRELGGMLAVFLLVFSPHVIRGFHEAPLHLAATSGDLDALRRLEAEGRDLAEPLAGRVGLLHLAAARGDLSMTTYLLSRPGIDPNLVRATDLRQPLHVAIERKQAAVALALLAAGADAEAEARMGRRPLHLAVEAGLEDVTLALLERRVELDRPDRKGDTALHLAAAKPGPLYARLRAAGASETVKNAKGQTPAELRAASTGRETPRSRGTAVSD